jgi:hypothetical protein
LIGRLSGCVLYPLRCSPRLLRGLPGSVARAFRRLCDRISNSLGCLAGTFAHFSGGSPSALTHLLRSLSGAFGGFAGAFANFLGGLSRALADFLRSLAGAFTYPLSGLSGALTDIFHRRLSTGAYVFDGLTRAFDGFASTRTNVLYGGSSASPDVLYGRPGA